MRYAETAARVRDSEFLPSTLAFLWWEKYNCPLGSHQQAPAPVRNSEFLPSTLTFLSWEKYNCPLESGSPPSHGHFFSLADPPAFDEFWHGFISRFFFFFSLYILEDCFGSRICGKIVHRHHFVVLLETRLSLSHMAVATPVGIDNQV